MTTDLRKWLAFGTGIGIEVGAAHLQMTAARLRPNGIAILGSATVTDFRNRPAAEWGSELTAFLRGIGCGHLAATVLLPRRDVIIRQVHLPGVADRDLEAAVGLQIDSLHPFADEEVAFSWARLGKTPSVLVGITRKEILESYRTMFAEAGIKVASITFSAGALYSAVRLHQDPPAQFIALHPSEQGVEVYGESEARPVFSAVLEGTSQRAVSVAAAELRVTGEVTATALSEVLPAPAVFPDDHDPATQGLEKHALPYATALAGACPWLTVQANLLPSDQRRSSSRLRYVPTAALAAMLLVLVGALALHGHFEDGRYLALAQTEVQKLEPGAQRAVALDRSLTQTRARSQLLDDFRRRSRRDMDVLSEVTRLIVPPGFVSSMELNGRTVLLTGEVDQAATLLKTFDESRMFESTEFTTPPARGQAGELFRIRSTRQEGGH